MSLPTIEELSAGPAPHMLADAPPGIIDGQARFRQFFCASLQEREAAEYSSANCTDWLFPAGGESPLSALPARPAAVALQVLFVTGAFSECFGINASPFSSAIADLRVEGHQFNTVVVSGRSGPDHNSKQIAEFLDHWRSQPDMPLVLVGYSKGTSDILTFLADYPEHAERVAAVVSVAGAVGGSPLADDFYGTYDLLFSHLPANRCAPGDGEVIRSLRTDVRREWLSAHQLPDHVRYYSLAAFTTRNRMARALIPAWETLLRYDRRNDGQLLAKHALIPHSTLLGYLNADHWAVAMQLEKDYQTLAHRRDSTPFPHTALLDAILLQVAEDQSASKLDARRQIRM